MCLRVPHVACGDALYSPLGYSPAGISGSQSVTTGNRRSASISPVSNIHFQLHTLPLPQGESRQAALLHTLQHP